METMSKTLVDDLVDLSLSEKKEQAPRRDPILDQEDSSGSEESSDDEDQGADIEFPRDNAHDLHQYLHRELNNLQNMEDGQKRKFALIKLYEIFVLANKKAPNSIYQELLPMIQKPLFKRLTDKIEKNRELACLIIREFFSRSDDLTMSIPYLIPVLIERLNASNLEGIEGLPDVLKPPTTQKPQVMIDPPEPSEEVRELLAQIVTIIVSSTVFDCLRAYIDNLVNIIKALCMDPCGEVIAEGCQGMVEFAQNGGEQLLHFSEGMARSLFTALVDKRSKVRIAGLKALYQVFFCGVWKYNANIMEHLIGFRDPNIVPVKDFYESTTRLNYFAMFVADRSTLVRDYFYKTVASMLMKLPDKKDHEPRLFPYLISGLYDQNDGIREAVFELIEELGKQYEEEYENDLRELKQFGYQPEWTLEGKVDNSNLMLPYPFVHRPGLGTRILVRSYVRRYLHALYKEVTDWIQENRERASNLLLCSIIFTEDFMTQFLDHLLVALYKAILENENQVVKKNIPVCLKLLGRYCSPKSYSSLVISAIRNELASFYPHTQLGSLKSFGYLLAGSMEILPKGFNLERIEEVLGDFIKAVNDIVIDQLDVELSDQLITSLKTIVDMLIQKKEQGVDISLAHQYEKDFFYMVIRSLGVYNNYRLASKVEPSTITISKKECMSLLNKLSQVTEDPKQEFFDRNIVPFFKDNFDSSESLLLAKDWSVMNSQWRMFYVMYDLMDTKQLQYCVASDSTETIYDRTCQIFEAILKEGESKNYTIKLITINSLVASMINKSLSFLSPRTCRWYFKLLLAASKLEWSKQQEKSKQLDLLLKLHNQLIDCSGVKLGEQNMIEFQDLMNGMEVFYKEKTEKAKAVTLGVVLRYLKVYNDQLIKGLPSIEKQEELRRGIFMTKITGELVALLTDYHDNVREAAQNILIYIAENFMPEAIELSPKLKDQVQMLRANIGVGWGVTMTSELRETAEIEAQLIEHLFADPSAFLKSIVTIMIDETSGRDNLIKIIKEFNKRTPFLMLNDFRIAHASNSLRRVEILKSLITTE